MVWLTGLELDIHVERLGLKPPRLDRHALLDNAYYLSFDQYFNDSFSLRSPLIFFKRWLDYRLFHMTDTTGVHVGTDGWLYSRLMDTPCQVYTINKDLRRIETSDLIGLDAVVHLAEL